MLTNDVDGNTREHAGTGDGDTGDDTGTMRVTMVRLLVIQGRYRDDAGDDGTALSQLLVRHREQN